jgi:hypothetical protein
MSKQRYVDTKLWSDSYISKLDPIEKLLFIYLMTNERTSLAGIYELPLKYMSVETGIESSMLENILSRFERDNKVVMFEGWVRLVNAIKHQNTNSPKIKLGIEKIISDVPTDVLKGLKFNSDTLPIEYGYPMDEVSHIIESNIIESNKTKLNKDSENSEKAVASSGSTKRAINPQAIFLAEKLHSLVKQRYNFTKERPTEVSRSSESIEKINRIDGFDYLLIEQVLDWSQQDDFWQQNILSGEKLRKQFPKLLIGIKKQVDNNNSRIVVAG